METSLYNNCAMLNGVKSNFIAGNPVIIQSNFEVLKIACNHLEYKLRADSSNLK